MRQVSSNLTLALKLFFPVFWVVFFGLLTLTVWVVGPVRWDLRLGSLAFYVAGLVVLYLTLWQLRRVEMDAEYVFATNYFKSARYPWRDVEKIEQLRFLFFYITYLHLRGRGVFGRRIVFLASQSRWRSFMADHPELASKVEG